jgi:hypothetical protein
VRILAREVRADCGQLEPRRLRRTLGFQAADGAEPLRAARQDWIGSDRIEIEGEVEVGLAAGPDEACRQDADHAANDAVDPDVAAKHGAAAEQALPRAVRHDHRRCGVGTLLATAERHHAGRGVILVKRPSNSRPHAQCVEHGRFDPRQRHDHWPLVAAVDRVHRQTGKRGEAVERGLSRGDVTNRPGTERTAFL